MSKPIEIGDALALAQQPDLLDRLTRLAERIAIDPDDGALVLRNGASSLALHEDGTIRITGTRIVQDAEREIALTAAWIDLN